MKKSQLRSDPSYKHEIKIFLKKIDVSSMRNLALFSTKIENVSSNAVSGWLPTLFTIADKNNQVTLL